MSDSPSSAEWLRETAEKVIPSSIRDKHKLRRAFDMVALNNLHNSQKFSNRWLERDARANHRVLYGEDPAVTQDGDVEGEDMMALGDININVNTDPKSDMTSKAPEPEPQPVTMNRRHVRSAPPELTPVPPPRTAARKAAGVGLSTALALAAGSGLAGVGATTAYHLLTRAEVAVPVFDPQLTGDWEQITDE